MPAQPASNGKHHATGGVKSRLLPIDADAVQDLLCVGFGPASLGVAIALHDALEAGTVAAPPRVLFLEKQEYFAWHAGMLLPGAHMQISFIKDLASLRDPRSAFTFINYLHCNDRLVEFTNLSTFLPARAEYEDYLRWCAAFFDDSVLYNSNVVAVEAEKTEGDAAGVTIFRVVVQDRKSGAQQVYRARNVLMATGGQASIPAVLPSPHPRVIHSSQYAHLVPTILSDPNAAYRVAVVGAGQSAAEIFNNIQVLYPNSRTSLVMRSEFLKPSDDSPFVNSIFNPSFVDELFTRSTADREHLITDARATNYGVVRLDLIDRLYERMYHQLRTLGRDETKWPHRILNRRRVARSEAGPKDTIRLFIEPDTGDSANGNGNGNGNGHSASSHVEELDVDLVIAATGYHRDVHVTMLKNVWPLLPETAAGKPAALGSWVVQDESAVGAPHVLSVSRDYEVQFAPGRVAEGSGVWLQGCCEGSHGLSDTLLSVLATRSGEIVESIFGRKPSH